MALLGTAALLFLAWLLLVAAFHVTVFFVHVLLVAAVVLLVLKFIRRAT